MPPPPSTASVHDDSASDPDNDVPITPQKHSAQTLPPLPTPQHHPSPASASHRPTTPMRAARSPHHASTASSTTSSESSGAAHSAEAPQRPTERESSEDAAMRKTGWLLLRSTARNLTNLLENIGARGLQAVQLYDNVRAPTTPPLAFIMLYKWATDRGDRVSWNPERVRNHDALLGPPPSSAYEEHSDNSVRDVLFVGQTMDNAAATQALILALLNLQQPDESESSERDFDVGQRIEMLRSFLEPLDPILRSAAVSSSAAVRDAHNRAARVQFGGHPELLDEDGKVRTSLLADELWMYSVFVPARKGALAYEMRGMADGAYLLDYCDEKEPDDWINVVFRTVDERIENFRMHHVPFSLFAIVNDKENDVATTLRETGRAAIFESTEQRSRSESESGEDEWRGGGSDELVKEEMERIAATHNYDTFFVEMLKLMASKGEINALIRENVGSSRRDRMEE